MSKSKNPSSEPQEIEPWGVNVPYIYLAMIFWAIGIYSIIRYDAVQHGYFMMLGAYSLYAGMIQRLFFPAKKYIALHLTTLALLAIPIHYSQALAFTVLTITEIWSLYDLKTYGYKLTKLPLNLLVLMSAPLSAVAWGLYGIYSYWVLVPPLLSYLLGVNIGVYSATLGSKMYHGIKQIPLIILVLLTFFIRLALPITLIVYLGYILIKRYRKTFNLSAFSTLMVSIILPLTSIYLGDLLHAFTLGVMLSYFSSCITYSTSGYNYSKEWIIPILLIPTFYLRFINFLFPFTILFGLIAVIYFIYLNVDSLGWLAIKYGMSKKYLEPYFKGKGITK